MSTRSTSACSVALGGPLPFGPWVAQSRSRPPTVASARGECTSWWAAAGSGGWSRAGNSPNAMVNAVVNAVVHHAMHHAMHLYVTRLYVTRLRGGLTGLEAEERSAPGCAQRGRVAAAAPPQRLAAGCAPGHTGLQPGDTGLQPGCRQATHLRV